MQKAFQDMFQYMSQKPNWRESVVIMFYFAATFILIGVTIAWVADKIINRKRSKPEAFDDLNFRTWKGDVFTKIKKAK